MDSTIRAIVNASMLPLSIIIVGVGGADFGLMNELDADDNPLAYSSGKSSAKTVGRDIVQFVAMRDFPTEATEYLLAKAVLEEIPDQFMEYMDEHKISPKPRTKRKSEELQINERFDSLPPVYSPN